MFHNILVGIDRSDLSQHVFDEALALAKAASASLILVNVLSPEDEASPSTPMISEYDLYPGALSRSVAEIYQELWQNYAGRELEMLRSLTKKAIAEGVETTFRQGFGSPNHVICELAQDLDVDLIVVGRRGRSGLNELFLGSVSNYVLHHAPCSVLTIHQPTQPTSSNADNEQMATVS